MTLPSVAIESEEEGLLDGLDGERDREVRIELRERLLADGATLEELKDAVAGGLLVILLRGPLTETPERPWRLANGRLGEDAASDENAA